MTSNVHRPDRTVGRLSRIRARLSESIYRAQLGPSREADVHSFEPRRASHGQRRI